MNYYVWAMDPVIFTLGPLAPRYYGVFFGLAMFLSFLLVRKSLMKLGKTENEAFALLFILIIGTVVGARLGHILFYSPKTFITDPLEIVRVWHGGLASHGAGIGLFLGGLFYLQKHPDLTLLRLGDCLAIGIAFTAFSVRLGNFFNSEILGRPSDIPWAIIFARVDTIPRHPAMLYEALSYLVLFLILFYFWFAGKEFRIGVKTGLLLVWVFASRFVIEFTKENQEAFENSLPINMGQILSIPFLIIGLSLLARVCSTGTSPPLSTARKVRHGP